jgi:hypothetical protein
MEGGGVATEVGRDPSLSPSRDRVSTAIVIAPSRDGSAWPTVGAWPQLSVRSLRWRATCCSHWEGGRKLMRVHFRGRWLFAAPLCLVGARSLNACNGGSDPAVVDGGSDPTVIRGGVDGAAESGSSGSEEASGPGSGSPGAGSTSANGGSSCEGPCCQPPAPGSSCSSENDGTTCFTSDVCPGGLAIEASVRCNNGTWASVGPQCPDLDGGVTEAGCPARQPIPSEPCSLAQDASCDYELVCPCEAGPQPTQPDACPDGETCAPEGFILCGEEIQFASAACGDGGWVTTPLPLSCN